jgi:hypothetical protein
MVVSPQIHLPGTMVPRIRRSGYAVGVDLFAGRSLRCGADEPFSAPRHGGQRA